MILILRIVGVFVSETRSEHDRLVIISFFLFQEKTDELNAGSHERRDDAQILLHNRNN